MEATLVRWLKKTGDQVSADEPLLEVSTDKVDTEIPSPYSGVVAELLVTEGDTVTVNQRLAVLAGEKAQVESRRAPPADPKPPAHEPAPQKNTRAKATPEVSTPPSPPAANMVDAHHPSRSSPVVRKMARTHNIDLSTVTGTGMGGKITKKDLEAYIHQQSRAAATGKAPGSDRRPGFGETPMESAAPAGAQPTVPPTQTKAPQNHEPQLNTTITEGQEFLDGVPIKREKMSKMRSLIAQHMVQSVRTSPHVTTTFEVDLAQVVSIREGLKKPFKEKEGFNLTYTAFFIHAAVATIKQHPIVNCSVDGDDILHKHMINIGCAVAIENGLIVPVIKSAGELNLVGIARKLNDLVTRARSKKLQPDDVRGGTFSITNPGLYGSIHSNPIINQPQVAILGIGAIVNRPVVIGDAIAIRPMVMISLTFDHRVIDGEAGAKYLADLKYKLEHYEKPAL